MVETPKLAEIIETSPTANVPDQKDLTISKPAENPPTLPSSFIPHKQSQVGQWLYPMAVVNVGSSSIPQVTQFVSITPENVLGPEDNLGGGAKIYFACPGPPCDYDPVGNLTQIQNPNSKIQTLQYDALNRLITLTDPLTHTTVYTYDSVGNLAQIVNPKSEIVNYQYDPANRVKFINYPGSTADVTFNYDKMGNVTSMLDGTGTTSYSYDKLYRLTGSANGAGQTITYTYHLAGPRAGLTYPNNQGVSYTYDAVNRLKNVTDWTGGRYTYTYNTAGRLATLNLPTGVTTTYLYDPAGRLTRLNHSSSAGDLAIYDYTLDAAGNRRRVTETLVIPGGSGSLSPFSLIGEGPDNSGEPPTSDSRQAILYLPLILKGGTTAATLTAPQPLTSAP